MFLVYINHCGFSWYIKQCPLFGRGPLLGASVNGELTVLLNTGSAGGAAFVSPSFWIHKGGNEGWN